MKSVRQRQIYEVTNIWNLIEMTKKNLFMTQKQIKDFETKLTATKGETGEGRDWEVGIGIYTHYIQN